MLSEASSLSNVVYLIGKTLKMDYGIDPEPTYRELGIPEERPGSRLARLPNTVVKAMWHRAGELSEDAAFGVRVGANVGKLPLDMFAHAWLASDTLVDALRCMIRYEDIINSGITEIRCEKVGADYVVSESYPSAADYPGKLAIDMSISSILSLSRIATGAPVFATRLEIFAPADACLDVYADFVRGPVVRSEQRNALFLPADQLEAPLPGAIPEIVDAVSRFAEHHRRSFETGTVAYQVRESIVQLLPSGSIAQDTIAQRLCRSASTLQRQLRSEGTSYSRILDDTREQMAKSYLADRAYSQAQIAFVLGFGDQSNFARAFKRWTGQSPGDFRASRRDMPA